MFALYSLFTSGRYDLCLSWLLQSPGSSGGFALSAMCRDLQDVFYVFVIVHERPLRGFGSYGVEHFVYFTTGTTVARLLLTIFVPSPPLYVNCPLLACVNPAGLQKITFASFNQPIEGIAWPDGLQHLTFMFEFNQPIDNIEWPVGLQSLRLGAMFNQPLNGVRWPPGLKLLSLGRAFAQSYRSSDLPEGLTIERARDFQDDQLVHQLQIAD